MIRPLEEKDLEFLASVKEIDFADGWNLNMLKSSFKANNLLGYVMEKETPFAFITCSLGIDTLDILDVYVKEEMRGNGHAKKLISFTENQFKNKGVKKVFLEVKESNANAINLYQNCGYKKISERKKYYSDGSTALIMIKEI